MVRYFAAVWRDMVARMSGIISLAFTLGSVYSSFFNEMIGVAHARLFFAVCAVGTFVYANYRVWDAERVAKNEAQLQLANTKPDFSIELGHTLIYFVNDLNITSVCMSVSLLNRGSDSVALRWNARYDSPNFTCILNPVNPTADEMTYFSKDNKALTIRREEFVHAQTLKSVARGSMASGRMVFEFPGNRENELTSQLATITVGCCDYNGREYKAIFKGIPTDSMAYWPNERVSHRDESKETVR